MKQMWKDTLILFVITLVAGLALGAVYLVTKDPIAVQQEKKPAGNAGNRVCKILKEWK